MKRPLLFLLVASFLLAAKSDRLFRAHGISFIIPKEWKMKKVKDLETHHSIDVRKRGFNSSGLVLITVFHQELDPEETLYHMLVAFGDVALYRNFAYTETAAVQYGKHEAVAAKFSMTILTIPHSCIIYSFQKNGKTFCILHQEADEDSQKNAPGFKSIEESFEVALTGKLL